MILPGTATRIDGWLIAGAIREDDNPSESNPKDDPYAPGGAFHREFNHFFDPYYDRPLSVTLLQWFYGSQPVRKAVDWALGTADAFTSANTRDTQSTLNHFTLFDAHEAMFRALTLKQRTANGAYGDLPPESAAEAEFTRHAYWATTFRALGDMVHLVQDMAQPQHTRNEAHSGRSGLEYLGAGHASALEKYIDERARRMPRRLADGSTVFPAALPYDGYGTPSFESYSDFWSTYTGPDSGTFGRGLADYSNSGFFTPAHNYGDTTYPNPSSIAYATESVAGLLTTRPDVTVRFLRGDVRDRYAGDSSNIRLTTESIWDGRVTLSGAPVRTYNLNRLNYDDMASLLIPRAVAYSAGFIEHFFRGELEINLPDAGFYGIVDHAQFVPGRSGQPTDVITGFKGFNTIKLKLKNKTPAVRSRSGSLVEQPMPAGSLTAVVKFHRNRCYDDLLTEWPATGTAAQDCRTAGEEIVTSDVVLDQSVPFETGDNPDGKEFTFDFPNRELPINAWDVVLQVIYRGRLGTEDDAVVVGTKDVSEPTFVAFMNTTDYVVINGRFYKPAEVAAKQTLFGSVSPGCRAGSPGSYVVNEACYNKADSFTFTAGSSHASITAGSDGSVGPRRLARLALLTDFAVPPSFGWQVDGVSCWVFLSNPFEMSPYPAQLGPDQTFSYGQPRNIRSVHAWGLNFCYADIAFPQTAPDALDLTQLDDLSGSETEPVPLTISGWN